MGPFRFADRPATLMGVVNVTPDSFSDGGRFADPDAAIAHGLALWRDGADIVDVGGESTRPGAATVAPAEQCRRVVPVIEALVAAGVPVSIDARHPDVVAAALAAGACVVNDVGGLRDPALRAVTAAAGASAVAMHMPHADLAATHAHRHRDDAVATIVAFLRRAAERALADGVAEIALDPGLGFGTTVDDNVAILRRLGEVVALGHPVLVGASRKRFVGALAGIDDPSDRDEASAVVHLVALERGATIVRAHDVARHRRAIDVWLRLRVGEPPAPAAPPDMA